MSSRWFVLARVCCYALYFVNCWHAILPAEWLVPFYVILASCVLYDLHDLVRGLRGGSGRHQT